MNFFHRKAPAPLAPTSLSSPRTPPVRLISYRVANMQGIGTRESQQDSFAFVNALDVREMKREGLFAMVADGMGGMSDGGLASRIATDLMTADFRAMNRDEDLTMQLRESALRTGEAVFREIGGGGGTTVLACIFYQEQCHYISFGDSCLYLLRDGELIRINREQNVRNLRYLETIRRGSLDPSAAEADQERDAIVGFLGMANPPEPDCFREPLALRDGDVFLLCSDGVPNAVPEEELALCLAAGTPDQMCRAIEQRILDRRAVEQDNYTALAVQCRK